MGPQLRVLHVVNSLGAGGLENGIVNMAHALGGTHEVAVACLDGGGAFEKRLPSTCEVFDLQKANGFTWRSVWELARVIRRWRPDVLHPHNYGPLLYTSLARGLALSRVPVCHGEHYRLRDDEVSLLRRWLYQRCQIVHGVGREMVEHLERLRLVGPSGARIVLNGVDCERFRPCQESRAALLARHGIEAVPDDALVIGMVGRVENHKRQWLLVEALECLALETGLPPIVFLCVGGDGAEGSVWREAVSCRPIGQNIRWAGFQSDPRDFYQMMDLLAVISFNEGLSNVMLEAMASGVAVLSHTACSGGEVFDPGVSGFLYEIQDVGTLADVLRTLFADRASLECVGAAARAHTVENLSLAAMAERYRHLYADAAGR
jgi:glycosyltransferase involved in cell wall biosynthesis